MEISKGFKSAIRLMFAMCISLVIFGGIIGCVTPKSAEQAVYALKQDYATVLMAAVAYKNLPDCEQSIQPCSNQDMVHKLQQADVKVSKALDMAETLVKEFKDSAVCFKCPDAITAAKSALEVFKALITTVNKESINAVTIDTLRYSLYRNPAQVSISWNGYCGTCANSFS